MISYFVYIFNLLKLKFLLYTKKSLNRFENYTPYGDITDPCVLGLIPNEIDWNLGTPNLNRKENITLAASNTFDKSALYLNLKWRPDLSAGVTTLLSKLTLYIDDQIYDYTNVTTYSPTKQSIQPNYITQYGSNGSCLKLNVNAPYFQYRVLFRGYMRKRSSPDEVCFVKLNLLIFQSSKLYDFREQFDANYLAHQVAIKRPSCGLSGTLNNLILHDRHEQTVSIVGEYTIQKAETKQKATLYLWGFHSRHFIDEAEHKIRSKRILGHFNNGRAFHIGIRENIDNNFDSHQQFTFGYTCFQIGPALGSISANKKEVEWDKVTSSSIELNFDVSGQGLTFPIKAVRRSESEFMDMNINSTAGWGIILINDTLDSAFELQEIKISFRQYQEALTESRIINPELFELKEFVSKPIVVDIKDRDCLYSGLVGAKASSLAQLRSYSSTSKKNYVVPDAIIMTKFAYEAIQEANPSLKADIVGLEARVGRGHLTGLDIDCERLQKVFETDTRMPSQVRDELGKQIMKDFNIQNLESLDERSFAVRSSSWGEDEDDMSAAGQLTTVLDVRGFEQLISAVMKCFASKFSHTNIEYKRQHGLPLDLPMAVVIQEMIQCEKAGVLFTCDPTTGDDGQMTITANYGLGESVVSGQTDPDTILINVINKGDDSSDQKSRVSIKEIKIGEKKVILGSGLKSPDSGVELDEGHYDRGRCCLSDEEIIELSECALELTCYFRCPRDIEWGYKDGQLYLFQSRPVTGLDAYTEFELMHEGDKRSRAEVEFVSRANVNEVMPYQRSPLDISYSLPFWTIITARFFGKLNKINPLDYTLNYSSEFLILSYLAFFSLRSKVLFNFARQGDGKRSAITRALEVGIFGHEVDNEELCESATDISHSEKVDRFEELRFNRVTLKTSLFAEKINKSTDKNLKRLRRDVQSLRFAKNRGHPLEGLLEQLKVLYRYGETPYTNHFMATLLSSKANYQLLELLSKYIQDPNQLYTVFSKFLASSPNVLSAEIPRRIDKMAKLIKQRGAKDIEEFVNMSATEGLKYVSRDLKDELAKEFDSFMVKFGHRCYNEFEISEVAWRDTPEKIVEMLQVNVKRYINSQVEEEPKKCLSNKEVIDELKINFSFLDRMRLQYLIAPRCQRFVSVREQTKNLAIEFIDVLRDATRLLARELRQNNRIPDEDLFYYLFYREVDAIVREPQPSIVVQAVKRRRMFKIFNEPWRFDEISKGYEFIPMHLKPSKELDAKLANAPKLIGTTASSGKVQGRVCLVKGYDELNKVQVGSILVTYSTDIAFSPVFPLISGIITEVGGLISHGAVIAREYGLPSVIGISDITKILKHGEEIILDADNAAIIRLDHTNQSE